MIVDGKSAEVSHGRLLTLGQVRVTSDELLTLHSGSSHAGFDDGVVGRQLVTEGPGIPFRGDPSSRRRRCPQEQARDRDRR